MQVGRKVSYEKWNCMWTDCDDVLYALWIFSLSRLPAMTACFVVGSHHDIDA